MIAKRNLRIGLVAGLAIVLYSMIVFALIGDFSTLSQEEFKWAEILGYLRYAILAVAIGVAMRAQNNGLGFWKLVREGVFVGLVIALLVGLMEAAYMYFNPDFTQKYGALYLDRMQANGATAAEIVAAQQEMADMAFLMTPGGMGVFYFFETAILGAVFALLMAGLWSVLRKKQTRIQMN